MLSDICNTLQNLVEEVLLECGLDYPVYTILLESEAAFSSYKKPCILITFDGIDFKEPMGLTSCGQTQQQSIYFSLFVSFDFICNEDQKQEICSLLDCLFKLSGKCIDRGTLYLSQVKPYSFNKNVAAIRISINLDF